MFKRDHHVRIQAVLQSLDANLLLKNQCWFAGGTAIVLRKGEYRESLDVDFLVSDLPSYRSLRLMLTDPEGFRSICRPGMEVTTVNGIRADQYGIRTMLRVAQAEIKFEIVFESRIQLDVPSDEDRISGVATLTTLDMAASKLLANSDRWNDGAIFSRDLIDLAMLNLPREEFDRALKKAEGAYGASIERDLSKSIQSLIGQTNRLEECMSALKIEDVSRALLWSRIRKLRPKNKIS